MHRSPWKCMYVGCVPMLFFLLPSLPGVFVSSITIRDRGTDLSHLNRNLVQFETCFKKLGPCTALCVSASSPCSKVSDEHIVLPHAASLPLHGAGARLPSLRRRLRGASRHRHVIGTTPQGLLRTPIAPPSLGPTTIAAADPLQVGPSCCCMFARLYHRAVRPSPFKGLAGDSESLHINLFQEIVPYYGVGPKSNAF